VRFVFDTNVVVSGLMLLGSPPRRAFDLARTNGRLLVSVVARIFAGAR
jgi:predicted nucleic acid-binding protein